MRWRLNWGCLKSPVCWQSDRSSCRRSDRLVWTSESALGDTPALSSRCTACPRSRKSMMICLVRRVRYNKIKCLTVSCVVMQEIWLGVWTKGAVSGVWTGGAAPYWGFPRSSGQTAVSRNKDLLLDISSNMVSSSEFLERRWSSHKWSRWLWRVVRSAALLSSTTLVWGSPATAAGSRVEQRFQFLFQ